MNNGGDLLTREEARAFLGSPKPATFATWLSRGIVPHYRVAGRTVLFSRQGLEAWLADRAVEPQDELAAARVELRRRAAERARR